MCMGVTGVSGDGWALAGARMSKRSCISVRKVEGVGVLFGGVVRVSVGVSSLRNGRDPGLWAWTVWQG